MDEAETWKKRAHALWQLLDDISTLGDACRDDNVSFRAQASALAESRLGVLVSLDGHTLVPTEQTT